VNNLQAALIEFNDSNISMIESLLVEAEREGYRFVGKTIAQWQSGTNRFSKPGECQQPAITK
jgi:hypothetical protein